MDLDLLTEKIFGLYSLKRNQDLKPDELREYTKFFLNQLKVSTAQRTRSEERAKLKSSMLDYFDKK